MHTITSELHFDEMIRSAKALATVAAWSKAGHFRQLHDEGPIPLESLDGDPRALRITARLLEYLGLLTRSEELFALTPAGRRLVDNGLLTTDRHLRSFTALSRMDAVLDGGGPVPDEDGERQATAVGVNPDDEEYNRQFMDMLFRRSEDTARACARWIAPRLAPGARVLDLGGGHGRYAREFTRAGLQATLMDLPEVLPFAKERHGDALTYREGDFFSDDLGGPYDAIFLSNIVHGLGPEENLQLARRTANALAPGGLLILKDMFLDTFERSPAQPVYFALTMLFYTDHGDSYCIDEAHRWFTDAGLTPAAPALLDGFQLLFATK